METAVVDRAERRDREQAWAIVAEYYEAVGVIVRDNPDEFEREYFCEGAGVWLARAEGEVVGCVALRPLAAHPASGEVKRLFVKPEWRGRGIAGLLLENLHDYAGACGYACLYLDSKDDLTAALRFYKTHGYIECPRYNDNPQATIFMRRNLIQLKRTNEVTRPSLH